MCVGGEGVEWGKAGLRCVCASVYNMDIPSRFFSFTWEKKFRNFLFAFLAYLACSENESTLTLALLYKLRCHANF